MGICVNQKGMTLVEVMVATLIIALVMMGAVLIATHTQRATHTISEQTLAQWVANNLAAEIKSGLHGTPTETGALQGQYALADQSWYWEANPDVIESVIQLNIQVRNAQDGRVLGRSKVSVWSDD